MLQESNAKIIDLVHARDLFGEAPLMDKGETLQIASTSLTVWMEKVEGRIEWKTLILHIPKKVSARLLGSPGTVVLQKNLLFGRNGCL